MYAHLERGFKTATINPKLLQRWLSKKAARFLKTKFVLMLKNIYTHKLEIKNENEKKTDCTLAPLFARNLQLNQ